MVHIESQNYKKYHFVGVKSSCYGALWNFKRHCTFCLLRDRCSFWRSWYSIWYATGEKEQKTGSKLLPNGFVFQCQEQTKVLLAEESPCTIDKEPISMFLLLKYTWTVSWSVSWKGTWWFREDSTALFSLFLTGQSTFLEERKNTGPRAQGDEWGLVSPARAGMLHTCIIAFLSSSPCPSFPQYFQMTNILSNGIKEQFLNLIVCIFVELLWFCHLKLIKSE